jgi:TolA-binding protein
VALVVGTGLAAPAWLYADEVDQLGGKVTELDARVYELSKTLRPPPEPGPEIGERRLIDAQVLYELKDYEAASIILFDVIEKYPSSSAYPEALFYLADSLYLKRDYLSSGRFFVKVVELGQNGKRYQEALQRLIELSLHTGDYASVEDYIAKLEGLAADKQLPSVPYVKGKYYYFRRQFDKALDALKTIPPNHIYYFHAQYFVAAANVQKGPESLDDALLAFGNILKTEPKTNSQKLIAELAHMGTARILLERGQLTQAQEEYAKIGSKSDQFNDMLYESAWVAIKGKDYVKARQQFDLLLLNAPESPLAPEVKLIVGSLQIRQNNYGLATDAYTKTRDEFEPVYKQLTDELTKTGDAPGYFRDLIAKNLGKFEMVAILPQGAKRWVRDEPDVARVATVISDETDLKKSLKDADDIVKRLEKALSGPARVNVFPELATARAKVQEISNALIEIKKQLAVRESQLLATAAAGQKAQLDQLDAERTALEAKLAGLPASNASMTERQQKARASFNDLDRRASRLQTSVNAMKNQIAAVRRLYLDALAKKNPAAIPPSPPDEPPPAPADEPAANASYTQVYEHVDKNLTKSEEGAKALAARVEKLKALAIEKPYESKAELDATTIELYAVTAAIEDVRKDILDHASNVGVGDSDAQAADQVRAQYEDVLKRQHELGVDVKSRLGGTERAKADQVDSILERVHGVDQKILAFNSKIDEILDARLKDVSTALNEEKQHVAGFHDALAGYTNESTEVGGAVVADSFHTVANRFYNVVVRADVGIIDVAWALKDQSSRESTRLVAERKRELKLLDDEFKDVLKDQP